EHDLQQSGVSLVIDDQSQGAAVMLGREDALLGMLSNLLENAIQQGAKIVQIALHVEDEIEIHLADDGNGISDELLPRIFDPFFTTRSGGTGLGLAVVQNLVLNHGGEILASHSTLGGALFQIHFPLASPAIEPLSTVGFNKEKQTLGVAQIRSLS
ncbi:MAG: ATP-binding protein, partial [Candidatus Thiodiazotropha taylori]|nr:ATP-binding protein [Candidatus Thiodiazotropha taylori]